MDNTEEQPFFGRDVFNTFSTSFIGIKNFFTGICRGRKNDSVTPVSTVVTTPITFRIDDHPEYKDVMEHMKEDLKNFGYVVIDKQDELIYIDKNKWGKVLNKYELNTFGHIAIERTDDMCVIFRTDTPQKLEIKTCSKEDYKSATKDHSLKTQIMWLRVLAYSCKKFDTIGKKLDKVTQDVLDLTEWLKTNQSFAQKVEQEQNQLNKGQQI